MPRELERNGIERAVLDCAAQITCMFGSTLKIKFVQEEPESAPWQKSLLLSRVAEQQYLAAVKLAT